MRRLLFKLLVLSEVLYLRLKGWSMRRRYGLVIGRLSKSVQMSALAGGLLLKRLSS